MYKNADCGTLRKKDAGRTVKVAGWVHRRRDHGSLIFIDLRDRSGLLQVVFNPELSRRAHETAETLRSEWVVQVEGQVRDRLPGAENPNIPTGEIELAASEMAVLGPARTPPFEIDDEVEVDELTRMTYRFIDLRRPRMQELLRLRHETTRIIWDHLSERGFLHVETPILLKSTPEGARDYVVPSRVHPGKFYALPQSPQQLKQLLMVSGVDRYFQIARCFRDEDLRADRQPEHTQLDLEMSFVHQEDVLELVEGLYSRITAQTRPGAKVQMPFQRIPHREAMDRFGTDKPDTRFGLELATLTDTVAGSGFRIFDSAVASGGAVRGFSAPGCSDYTRRRTDELIEIAKSSGSQGLITIALAAAVESVEAITLDDVRSPVKSRVSLELVKEIARRTGAGPGSLILIAAGPEKSVNTTLSILRNEMGRRLELADSKEFRYLFVTDFPLFELDEELERWTPEHHVFSAPQPGHEKYLESDPGKAHGQLFDLVCNGTELGSGSIRIHDRSVQEQVFNVIGYSKQDAEERFEHLLRAFEYGAPPHGGMGLGLDRLVAVLAGETSIREVIAFPKTQAASDPLFDAPWDISKEQLEELHIRIGETPA